MRLERRPQISRAALLWAPLVAVLFTLAVSGLLVLWAGAPVARTYALLVQGAFGSTFALTETLTKRYVAMDTLVGKLEAQRKNIVSMFNSIEAQQKNS